MSAVKVALCINSVLIRLVEFYPSRVAHNDLLETYTLGKKKMVDIKK